MTGRDGLVDFMVVGVQKAGTTALYSYLEDDPAYATADVKEVHFFDDEAVDWARPDYGAYHAHFPAPDGRPRGEATPIYIYWPGALERIAAYNPAARLILMLRDPVERAWSHWRMERARGVETESFAWCIRQGRQRLFRSEPWGHDRETSYVERGFYGEQVERLHGLFPKQQVLILRARALASEPLATLTQVARFLGAPPPRTAEARAVHVGADTGTEPAPEDAAFLRRLYARDDARLRSQIGWGFG